MAIHGPFYWKQIAKELRNTTNELSDTLTITRIEKSKTDDRLANMRIIGWRIKAIHQCLSGLEFEYAIDILKEVQERLERERDKTHVKCE